MKIAISGGGGFIGTTVTRQLLKEEHSVHVFDKMGYGFRKDFALVNPSAKFTAVDVSDPEFTVILGDAGEFDLFIIMHSESHVDRSIEESVPFAQSNVVGTANIVDALLYLKKEYEHKMPYIWCFSTDEVFGETDIPAVEVGARLNPRNPYAATKAAQELLIKAYANTHQFKAFITRCCNVYGPGQLEEKFIPRSIELLRNDKKLKLYGEGKEKREWIHVQDVAEGCGKLISVIDELLQPHYNKDVPEFHLTTRELWRNVDVAEALCDKISIHFTKRIFAYLIKLFC